MDGIVIVDKPQDWTSQDVTARLRRVFNTRRIGHGGTLDPMATGVLPVFVGRATRGVEFFEHAEKTYETVLRLGLTTDTEDITGTVLTETKVSVTEEQIAQTLEAFRGEIMQIPPMYSALKVNGQKLCDLARKGKTVERQPRPITIHELTLLERGENTLRLRVRCSKGTYIRTLCADIGEKLGCGGTMKSLERTRVGQFSLEKAVTLSELEQIRDRGAFDEVLFPVEHAFLDCPKLHMREEMQKRLENGNAILPEHTREGIVYEEGWVRMARSDGSFAGVYTYNRDRQWYQPVKMFLERD